MLSCVLHCPGQPPPAPPPPSEGLSPAVVSQGGLLSSCVQGLLIAGASFVGEHRLLGERASVVVALGLSCSAARRIFPDQGLNPRPLLWQVDS